MNISKRGLRAVSVGLLSLLTWTSPAVGQDRLKLQDGATLVGRATAYDDASEVVTFVTDDGRTLRIAAGDLDPISAYKLAKARTPRNDAAAELRLGGIARAVGLYAHAGRHLGNALKLDPGLAAEVEQERAVLRRAAAEYCMRMAREALQDDDTKTAEEWLTKLVEKLPNEPEAAQAETMLTELYPKNHEPLDDVLEDRLGGLLENELKTGKKHYDEMLAGIQKGLTNTRSERAAKTAFEGAWSSGERALQELEKVKRGTSETEASVREQLVKYRMLTVEHMVAAQLHLASLYTVQTDYKNAQKAVGLALSVDPKNRDALAARARIEEAANRGWGWR